ncbi:MAG: hypothetical protein KDA48_12945, partial [Amphiplicatus sp.]|nr:hypothetical protein [Amphiplicatus sp.]
MAKPVAKRKLSGRRLIAPAYLHSAFAINSKSESFESRFLLLSSAHKAECLYHRNYDHHSPVSNRPAQKRLEALANAQNSSAYRDNFSMKPSALPGQVAKMFGDFPIGPIGQEIAQTEWWAPQSRQNASPGPKFTDNSELTGKIRGLERVSRISSANSREKTAATGEFTKRHNRENEHTAQGIFFTEQGKFVSAQGIHACGDRIDLDLLFVDFQRKRRSNDERFRPADALRRSILAGASRRVDA